MLSQRNVNQARDFAQDLEQRFDAWRRARLGPRGLLLYVLSAPLAVTAVIELAKGDWRTALASAVAFLSIVAGARINRQALRESLLGAGRRYTPAPMVPLKWRAAALVTVGTAVAAHGVVEHGLIVSGLFGLMALAGFHMAYDLVTAQREGPVNPEVARDARLRRTLAQAESRILTIEGAAETIGNRELSQRLARIASQARSVLDMIAERPAELFKARKFLSVYLEGAERVTARYAKTHPIARSQSLEQNFRNVLQDIERVFDQQREHLLDHDVEDLDIHIEVLRKRMTSEGIV